MTARALIFGSLGGMLLLVLALLLVGDGQGPAPAADRPRANQGLGDVVRVGEQDTADVETPAEATPGDATRPEVAGATDEGGELTDPGGTLAPPAAERPAGGERPTPRPDPTEGQPADRGAGQDVEEILRATGRRYEGVRALQADFEQELTNALLGRTTRSAGTIYQRQPDRFLMRFSDPAGDVIVSDGDYFWIYYPSADPKQVIRSTRGAGGLDLRSQFVGNPVERFEATYHGTETVRGRRTHVLTLVPREPVGYRRLKVWIDADDNLIRRFELTEDSGTVRRFELTDLRINPNLPDELFRFEPPAGAVVVTR